MAAAPSKMLSSLGQPFKCTTGFTPGTRPRHFSNSKVPALNSCSPEPWLCEPAIRTIFFDSAAEICREAQSNTALAKMKNFLMDLGRVACSFDVSTWLRIQMREVSQSNGVAAAKDDDARPVDSRMAQGIERREAHGSAAIPSAATENVAAPD